MLSNNLKKSKLVFSIKQVAENISCSDEESPNIELSSQTVKGNNYCLLFSTCSPHLALSSVEVFDLKEVLTKLKQYNKAALGWVGDWTT